VRGESRVGSTSGELVDWRGEKRLEVVAGGGCNQWLGSMACFFSLSGSSEEGRPRFEGTVIQAEGVGWCVGKDVIGERCSEMGGQEGGGSGGGGEGERSRTRG
jgi:hypothetical protein